MLFMTTKTKTERLVVTSTVVTAAC